MLVDENAQIVLKFADVGRLWMAQGGMIRLWDTGRMMLLRSWQLSSEIKGKFRRDFKSSTYPSISKNSCLMLVDLIELGSLVLMVLGDWSMGLLGKLINKAA